MLKKVLSLGQCGADSYAITSVLHERFAAEVVDADTFAEARALLAEDDFALVLVNRVLDRDGSAGLSFIKELKTDPALATVPVMLVSNFADAQQQAVALGAVSGFGKAALRDQRTTDRLAPYLQAG